MAGNNYYGNIWADGYLNSLPAEMGVKIKLSFLKFLIRNQRPFMNLLPFMGKVVRCIG